VQQDIPIAISYRPKEHNYLPVVVAAIRRCLGDRPIVLLTEKKNLPPASWLNANGIQAITDWEHSPRANKILRLWEHQDIFARHFERWIWWHDDMLLLRPVEDPAREFNKPRVAHGMRQRPNRKLARWHGWLWDTLNFFRCQNIAAPNPVLHVPRLVERSYLESIPAEWNRKRLLFEPTYLLWKWHQQGLKGELDTGFRKSVFKGEMPAIAELEAEGFTILNWGRKIDHSSTARAFGERYPLRFEGDE
jgi:hypothetical protein